MAEPTLQDLAVTDYERRRRVQLERDAADVTSEYEAMVKAAQKPTEPEAPAPKPPPTLRELAGRMFSDIGKGLYQEFVPGKGFLERTSRGMLEAGVQTAKSIQDLSTWIESKSDVWKRLGEWERSKGKVPLDQWVRSWFTEGQPAETVTGGLIENVAQWATAMIPAMKLTRLVPAAKGVNAFTRSMAAGALVDAFAFDPHSGRMSNLINTLTPALKNPLTEYLAASPEDSDAEGRFKNAVEGLGLGAGTQLVLSIAGWLRRAAIAKAAPAAAPSVEPPKALPPGPQKALPAHVEAQVTPPPVISPHPPDPATAARELRAVLEMIPPPRARGAGMAPEGTAAAKRPYTGTPAEIEAMKPPVEPQSPIVGPRGEMLPEVGPTVTDAIERERLRAFERTPLSAAARQQAAEVLDVPMPSGPLHSSMDIAVRRAEEAILEPRPATKPITLKAPIAGGAPAVAEAAPVEAAAKELTPEMVDSLFSMRMELEAAAPGSRHFVMDELGKVQNVLGQKSTYPDWMTAITGPKKSRQAADKIMAAIDEIADGKLTGSKIQNDVLRFLEERPGFGQSIEGILGEGAQGGMAHSALLARMAVGAIAGGATGDTPEERIRNAFLGMGIGALASKELAGRIIAKYKASDLADEAGAVDFSKWRRKPSVQAGEVFQPNYRYVDADVHATRVLKNTHREVSAEILARMKVPTKLTEIERKGAQLIADGKVTLQSILERRPVKFEELEPTVTAARMLRDGVADRLAKTMQSVAKGDLVAVNAMYEDHALLAAIVTEVRPMSTAVARATAAHKISSRPIQGLGAPISSDQLVDFMAKTSAVDPQEFARSMLSGKVTAEALAEKAGYLWWGQDWLPRALKEVMYFNMLSGESIIKNAASNLGMLPLTSTERALGGYMPHWGKGLPIQQREGIEMFGAMHEALTDYIRHLWRREPLRGSYLPPSSTQGFYDIRAQQAITAEAMGIEQPQIKWMVDKIDTLVHGPGNVMGETDWGAKAVLGRGMQKVEALRQARLEGLEVDSVPYKARVQQLMDDPTLLSSDSVRRINDFAETNTFTKDFEQGSFLGWIQKGPENQWLNYLYALLMFPFRRTPLRLAEQALNRFPILGTLMPDQFAKLRAGGADAQIVLAQQVTGLAIMSTAGYLTTAGWMTGNGGWTGDQDRLFRQAGIPRRSFWDPVSGKYRSYDGFEPFSTAIAAGADLAALGPALLARGQDVTLGTLIAGYANAVSMSINQKNYWLPLSRLVDLMTRGGPDSFYDRALEYFRRQASAMLEPAMFRQFLRPVDPTTRQAASTRDEFKNLHPVWREFTLMLREAQAGVPGFSDVRDEQGRPLAPAERHLITGQPILGEMWPYVTMKGPQYEPNSVMAEIKAVAEHMPGVRALIRPLPDWIGGQRPGSSIHILTGEDSRDGVRLNPWERDEWHRLMTQEVRIPGRGGSLEQAFTRLFASDLYKNRLTWEGKAARIEDTWNAYKKVVRTLMTDKYPDLAAEVYGARAERAIQVQPTNRQEILRQYKQRAQQRIGARP